jgi:hypothetical protein
MAISLSTSGRPSEGSCRKDLVIGRMTHRRNRLHYAMFTAIVIVAAQGVSPRNSK